MPFGLLIWRDKLNDKIFDFLEAHRETQGKEPTITGEEIRDAILKKLAEISSEVACEYVKVINSSVDEQLTFRDIIMAADKPNLAVHLLKGLPHQQLSKLKEIVVNLIMYERQKSVNEIVNSSLKISGVTLSSLVKARRLYFLVKEKMSGKSENITEGARLLHVLSTIIAIYGNETVRPYLQDKLAKLSDDELDKLIDISCHLLGYN